MTVPHDHGGQSRIEPPSEASWSAWSPEELAERLKGVDVLWYVVGGWALDLHAGNLRRAHDDLEFAVLPQGIRKVAAHLSDLTFFEHINGRLVPWDTDGAIREDAWQFWGADLGARKWRVDMMVERGTRRHWVYKRDASIRQERNKAIRKSVDGIPYLAPANILLFKAKHCRPKDDDDFDALLPVLSSDDRAALYSWLKSQSPSHKWLSRLR